MVTEKKVLKKAVAKSPAKKPVATKAGAKKGKTLVYAEDTRSFWVRNGQVLNSLLALRDALANMEKTVFTHHVSKDKNDFADWVEKVLKDAECAKALRLSKTPASSRMVVVRFLKTYQP